MIILRYQIIKIFLQKVTFQMFAIKKVKNTVPPTYVNGDIKSAVIVGRFYEKEL